MGRVAGAALFGLALSVGCGDPADAPPSSVPAREASGGGALAPAEEDPDRGLEIVRSDEALGAMRFSARAHGCDLQLVAEPGRLWLRSERSDGEIASPCDLLAPALRDAWVALSERVPEGLEVEPLGIVISFYEDLPSVERWFRHQAEDPKLQADLRAERRDASQNARLAEAMLESGALSRYAELFGALGYRIGGVSIEKVEVRTVADWGKALPEVDTARLAAEARVALPYLTWLELRPAPARAEPVSTPP